MKQLFGSIIVGVGAALSACAPSFNDDTVYTLYRDSAASGSPLRVHVATFDAREQASYNRDNCEIAKGLFQAQPGVTVTYWCERGRYSKN